MTAPTLHRRRAPNPDRDRLVLLGPDAGGLLHAALAEAGGTLGSWRATSVAHQPGRATVVQYRAAVRWSTVLPTTGRSEETLVADARPCGTRPGTRAQFVSPDGATEVALWRWSNDPALPGLIRATDPAAIAGLLAGLDAAPVTGSRAGSEAGGGTGAGPAAVRLRTRAYRPGRRAVIEASGWHRCVFLKVVRPTLAEALHRRHRLLAAAGLPVPDSIGWSQDGIVVLEAVPGHTLRQALTSCPAGTAGLPTPEAVVELLERLPEHLLQLPGRRGPRAAAAHHAAVIADTVPAAADLARRIVDGVGRLPEHPSPTVPAHGDLYEQQLLVDGHRITGLLDLDTAGPGARVDDLANCCAHLSLLADRSGPAGIGPTARAAIAAWGASLLRIAERDHHPADVRARIAAGIVGLATGPYRVQERDWSRRTIARLELAERWRHSAARC